MDFYHFWLYQYVINTIWFLWIIVGVVIVLNFSGPVIFWLVMTGKGKSKKKQKEKPSLKQ